MISNLLNDLADLFYPRTCAVCRRVLLRDEPHLCTHCLQSIPRTDYHRTPFNPMEQLFAGKFAAERCSAFFFFRHDSDFRRLIHHIKYHGNKECGAYLGQLFAEELAGDGFFDTIDYIVPIPLHKRKLRRRGFNQSEWIAAGISAYTRIPVRTDLLEHRRENESQTRKGIYTRWLNTRDVFHAPHTPGIEGCHLLIIDDVVTTGATISACAESLQKSNRVKISVLTLAIAR